MHYLLRTLLIVVGIVLLSCEEDDLKQSHSNLPRLNIQDAAQIIVYDQNSNTGGRLATSETNLYKIKTDGTLDVVRFVNDDGSELGPETFASIEVHKAYDVNSEFFALGGSFFAWDTLGTTKQYMSLLVRKSDGAIFDLEEMSLNLYAPFISSPFFQQDNRGNFYFSNDRKIIKIDGTNLSKISYLPTGQIAYKFVVDGFGNCVYQDGEFGEKLKRAVGGIVELQSEEFWLGANGSLYFTSRDQDKAIIEKIIIDDAEISSSREWVSPDVELTSIVSGLYHMSHFQVKKSNSVIFLDRYNGAHFEYFEEEKKVVKIELPAFDGATFTHSSTYGYIATGTSLYRMSLSDYSYVNMLPPAEYEIYSMNVNENDIVEFSALRYSDEKKIIAEVTPQGQINILEEEKDRDVIYLKRIN